MDAKRDGKADSISDVAFEGCAACCNGVTQTGPSINESCTPGRAPAATGGRLVDGSYILTSAVLFVTCSSPLPLGQASIVISGNGTILQVAYTTAGVTSTSSYTLGASGSQLQMDLTCGMAVPVPSLTPLYSATPETFALEYIEPSDASPATALVLFFTHTS